MTYSYWVSPVQDHVDTLLSEAGKARDAGDLQREGRLLACAYRLIDRRGGIIAYRDMFIHSHGHIGEVLVRK